MLRGWIFGASPADESTPSLDATTQAQELESALEAATLIMNDDVDGAEEGLSKGDSPFHKIGKGVVAFVRATLGFELDVMREAAQKLSDAETSAYYAHRQSQNDQNAYRSAVYAPGTEYVLCQSMAQLESALVGVLSESLTESLKAFYKLRKAYIALDGIMEMERKYLQKYKGEKTPSSSDNTSVAGGSTSSKSSAVQNGGTSGEKLSNSDAALLSNPIDAFIYSGANLCFGLLMLLISMMPPTFSKLLYVVGFRGDRELGLRMLWKASKFRSLSGAVAALGLLAYYNGVVRFCDILPNPTGNEEDIQGYPKGRLANLLNDMRQRFPKSQLWLLEEARMASSNRQPEASLELLSSAGKSPLQQVEALVVFEKSMEAMHLHRYELTAESFLQCGELNSWSRALYFYIAGASYIALYRQNKETSPELAKKHADRAVELLREVPAHAGKKRLMARQLPFDVFVARKLAKWEARAKEWGVDLVDAVGVDPVEEMIFFWNGYNCMPVVDLEESLKSLAWSESPENKMWHHEGADEKAILALLRSSIYRSLRRHDEAKEILEREILHQDKSVFKGHLKDEWTLPTAHYEMACNLWMERYSYRAIHKDPALVREGEEAEPASDDVGDDAERKRLEESRKEHDRAKTQECKGYLEKVARWGQFDLDVRIGLKIATGEETIRNMEAASSS